MKISLVPTRLASLFARVHPRKALLFLSRRSKSSGVNSTLPVVDLAVS